MGISQITTVKGRYDFVSKNIKRWLNSSVDEIVLVDYNCPQETGYKIARDFKDTTGLTIVIVKPELAGKHFHLTKARNIGVTAAKHDILFMCDADCWTTSSFIERVNEKFEKTNSDLLLHRIEASQQNIIHKSNADLPVQWCMDGQCFIRNYLFHTLNGYNEQHTNWGGESYDLYIRASDRGAKIGTFDRCGIYLTPHADNLRTEYLAHSFEPDRRSQFAKSLRFLKRNRKINRVNPGTRFGADSSRSDHIILVRNGKQRVWRPGEDDL